MSGTGSHAARWREHSPELVELAEVLALAVQAEPALVRDARLLLGHVDAALEADLWFSPLVASHGGDGIVLEPEVAAELRRALAESNPTRLAQARDLVRDHHAHRPWSIRLEEELYYWSARTDREARARTDELLVAAGARMRDQAEEHPANIARWLLRAMVRMPAALRVAETGRSLAQGASVMVHGRLEEEEPHENDWRRWLPAGMKTTPLWVRRDGDRVDLARRELDQGSRLEVPATEPVAIDVNWHDGIRSHDVRIWLRAQETRQLLAVADEVELVTILGDRFAIRSEGDESEPPAAGFDFSALRAVHRPFLERKRELDHLLKLLEEHQEGWIQIEGEAGVGKTALLLRAVDELEERDTAIVLHLLDGGPEAWSRSDVLESSLRQQLMRLIQEPLEEEGAVPLGELAQRCARERGRLVVVVDGLHRFDSQDKTPLDALADAYGVLILTTGRKPQSAIATATLPLEPDSQLCAAYLHDRGGWLAEEPRVRPTVLLLADASDTSIETYTRSLRADLERSGFTVHRDQSISGLALDRERSILVSVFGERSSRSLAREIPESAGWRARYWIDLRDLPGTVPSGVIALRARPTESATAAASRIENEHPPMAPELHEDLLELAEGNCGRLADMVEWLARQPAGQRDIMRLPPTLSGRFDEVWDGLLDLSSMDEETRDLGMAIYCAAREALPVFAVVETLPVLNLSPWPFDLRERALLRTEQDEDTPWTDYWLEPSHPSVLEAVARRVGPYGMRKAHRTLFGFAGPTPTEPSDESDHAFRRAYARRYGLFHLIAASNYEEAWEYATLTSNLAAIRDEVGDEALISVLRDAEKLPSKVLHGERADVLPTLRRVLSEHITRFGSLPEDLAGALHVALQVQGWSQERIASTLGIDSGLFHLVRLDRPNWAVRERGPSRSTVWTMLGSELLSGDNEGNLRLAGTDLVSDSGEAAVTALLGVDAKRVIVGFDDGNVGTIERSASQWDWRVSTHSDAVLGLELLESATGPVVVSWSEDGTVVGRELLPSDPEEPPRFTLAGHTAAVTGWVQLDERYALTTSRDGALLIWNLATSETLFRRVAHPSGVTALDASLENQLLLTGGSDGELALWDLAQEPLLVRRWKAHAGEITSCGFLSTNPSRPLGSLSSSASSAPDQGVSTSVDGTLRRWHLESATELDVLSGFDGPVRGYRVAEHAVLLGYSDDGTVRTTASPDVALVETGSAVRALFPLDESYMQAACDNGWVARFVSTSANVKQLDPSILSCAIRSDGKQVVFTRGSNDPPRLVSLAPDSGKIHLDGTLFAADPTGGWVSIDKQEILRYDREGALLGSYPRDSQEEPAEGVRVLRASDPLVVLGTESGAVRVFAPESGESLHLSSTGPVTDIAIHPKNSSIVTTHRGGAPQVWRLDSGEEPSLGGGDQRACAFSPAGVLAIGAETGAIRLLDPSGQRTVATLTGHWNAVRALAFLDERWLVSVSLDSTLRLWDIYEERADACLFGEAPFLSLGVSQTHRVAAGDSKGNLWVVDLDLVESVGGTAEDLAGSADDLQQALDRLSERERFVLSKRFGLSGDRELSLAEIGAEMNISIERVRQIQRSAISKLEAFRESAERGPKVPPQAQSWQQEKPKVDPPQAEST